MDQDFLDIKHLKKSTMEWNSFYFFLLFATYSLVFINLTITPIIFLSPELSTCEQAFQPAHIITDDVTDKVLTGDWLGRIDPAADWSDGKGQSIPEKQTTYAAYIKYNMLHGACIKW